MASMPHTPSAAGAWQRPVVNRLGVLGDVADNRGGNNGHGRWNGMCKGRPCLLS